MEATKETGQRQRLLWQCRRGMLELDLLLRGFVDNGYDDLNIQDKELFEKILEYPDQILLEYLLEQAQPIDKDVATLIQSIRRSVTP